MPVDWHKLAIRWGWHGRGPLLTRILTQSTPLSVLKSLLLLLLCHWSHFNLTLTGAPDKTHYTLNYAVYLSPPPPPPSLIYISSLGMPMPIPSSDAQGLVEALSGRHLCFPSDSIAILSVLCIAVLLISLGGTITLFLFGKNTTDVDEEGKSNGGDSVLLHRRSCLRGKKELYRMSASFPRWRLPFPDEG